MESLLKSEDLSAKLTAEVFVIPLDDRENASFLIYAPLRKAGFVANQDAVNQLARLKAGSDRNSEGVGDFYQFLRELQIVDGGPEVLPLTNFEGDPAPTEVTLFLTTACNLRCTYCYAAAGDTPLKQMGLDVAKRGIDFIVRNAVEQGKDEIGLTFHGGGEPSVNWSTLTGAYEYAKAEADSAGINLFAVMGCNGVVPDFKLEWIIKHLDAISLSFDGLPEIHDSHRVDVRGEGTAERVSDTIRRLDEAAFNYSLRLTVTAENIPRMEDSVRYVCESFTPRMIQVEPAYQMGRWTDAPTAETAEFIEGFRQAQSTANALGHQIQFSAARAGTLSNHFCGVTQDSFCLTASGSVSACFETFMAENDWSRVFFYGDYDQESGRYEFDLEKLNHLRRQSVEHREFCEGCFAKWSCGGDCYHKSLSVNGERDFQGSDRCHIIRELTKDQLLTRIAESGGIFWHEERDLDSETQSTQQGKEVLR